MQIYLEIAQKNVWLPGLTVVLFPVEYIQMDSAFALSAPILPEGGRFIYCLLAP
jgi:hypothetical protein